MHQPPFLLNFQLLKTHLARRPLPLLLLPQLYCGNLSWDTTKDDLANLFGKYGQVDDAFIATDRETGRARGFGFVTLEANAAMTAAGELNNTVGCGSRLSGVE